MIQRLAKILTQVDLTLAMPFPIYADLVSHEQDVGRIVTSPVARQSSELQEKLGRVFPQEFRPAPQWLASP